MYNSKISKHYKNAAKSVRSFEASLKRVHLNIHPKESLNSLPCSSSTEHLAHVGTSSNIQQINMSYENLNCTTVGATSNIANELLPDYPYCFSSGDSDSNSSTDGNARGNETLEFQNFVCNEYLCSDTSIATSNNAESTAFISQLSKWAITHNITHAALNDLLKILKHNHPELPNDARTLLHTPRMILLKDIEPGKYYHFGLEFCLNGLLKSINYSSVSSIEILINIDGLPLSSSSSSQFYPILCSLYGGDNVGTIGVYHGHEKPRNANQFLNDFVEEVISLGRNFVFNGHKCHIKIKGFICDAPAKSYIKYSKGHSGYKSCTKCYTEGSFVNGVCFPQLTDLRLRSDFEFRNKFQEEHHTGTSVIENIPGIDMVKSFPLDYMHLVCLGVVKKLIFLWVNGKTRSKLSFRQISHLSELLVRQTINAPFEFNRKPRHLNEYKRWKATEF